VLASQFAFPEEACRAVYAADARYGGSLANLDRWNNERDFVFRDGDADVRELQTIALAGGVDRFSGTARIAINY
jgi:hypothetical protein